MMTRNIPMQCVPKKMHRITVISRIRTWFRSSSVMSGSNGSKAAQPELRDRETGSVIREEFDLPEYDAEIITDSKHMADVFEATTADLQ